METSRNRFQSLFAGAVALAVVAGFFAPIATQEAQARSYISETKTNLQTIQMAPGEVREVKLEFTNRSDFTWSNDGAGYISLYTHGPKYRKSVFDPGTWLGPTQVKRINEKAVVPGGVASMNFELRAPATEGKYTETFWLASESRAWLEGGEVELVIDVTSAGVKEEPSEKKEEVKAVATVVEAEAVMLSVKELNLKAGQSMSLKAIVKNTGSTAWSTASLVNRMSLFAAPDWDGAIVSTAPGVGPGDTVVLPITVTAPQYNGLHNVKFEITADGVSSGEGFELPVRVTDGNKSIDELNEGDYDQEVDLTATVTLIDEPTVRVGLFTVDDETNHQVIVTSEGAFTVQDEAGVVLAELAAGAEVTAYYTNNRYYYNAAGAGLKETFSALRFVPAVEDQVMTITNFDRRATRGDRYADNMFRGVLELRYNTSKSRTWMINELPVELYLRGLAETSQGSPIEYQKTIITAARSFAYYYLQHPNSARTREGFDLSSYSTDQVYRGYGFESRTPDVTQAAQETHGQTVHYNGASVITPYFAQSNGYTKNWSQVWWGDREYARSVAVPCDSGKAQRGHGVGISATGAICMAKEGMTSTEIISHFFTGVEVKRVW